MSIGNIDKGLTPDGGLLVVKKTEVLYPELPPLQFDRTFTSNWVPGDKPEKLPVVLFNTPEAQFEVPVIRHRTV
jgi:hypothetical protein